MLREYEGNGLQKVARLVCSPWAKPPIATAGGRVLSKMDRSSDIVGHSLCS